MRINIPEQWDFYQRSFEENKYRTHMFNFYGSVSKEFILQPDDLHPY